MNTLRLFAACAAASAAAACASGGGAPASGGDTGLTPIVSLTGGGGTTLKRTGNFAATTPLSAGVLSADRPARVDGKVTVTSETSGDDQFTVVIEINSQRGAEELLWTVVPGQCGAAGLPLVSPRQNPRIDVQDSGIARVTAEFRGTMTPDQTYHINLYANQGTDETDVVACATLR
jgi:hypothetical protein